MSCPRGASRDNSAPVPALGGQIDAEVRSEALTADGASRWLTGPVQQVVAPSGASGIFLLRSERRASVGLEAAGFQGGLSVPVSALQFNPLCCNFNYSNDASLLLPDQAAGSDYVVMSQPHLAGTDLGSSRSWRWVMGRRLRSRCPRRCVASPQGGRYGWGDRL